MNRKGFTLIELIIVISIIILMAAAAVPAYQNYGAKSELSLKADEIKALIDRGYAYSNNPSQGKDCAQVAFTFDRVSIQFGKYVKTNSGSGCTIDSSLQNTTFSSKDNVDIPKYMTISSNGSGSSGSVNFVYSYYPGKFNIDGGASSASILLESTKTARSANILLNTAPYKSTIELVN